MELVLLKVRLSGSDVTDGVGTITGEEDEVSESFCSLIVGRGVVFFSCWSFMDQEMRFVLQAKFADLRIFAQTISNHNLPLKELV